MTKDQGPRNIGHKTGVEPDTEKIYFVLSLGFTVSYLAHYETLLLNTTNIITKCGCYFITKNMTKAYY